MMTRCAYMIGAMALFSLNGAIGQTTAGASLPGNEADRAGQNPEQRGIAGTKPDPRAAPPGGNPLWGIPIDVLSATRERPLFTASRRPPAPPPPPMAVVEAPPPPPPAAPETPPFTLVGTAVGHPQDVALVIDQTTKSLVRLHTGEAVSGWYLRKVDARAMTLEKNSRVVSVALPAPGEIPAGSAALSVASGAARQF